MRVEEGGTHRKIEAFDEACVVVKGACADIHVEERAMIGDEDDALIGCARFDVFKAYRTEPRP